MANVIALQTVKAISKSRAQINRDLSHGLIQILQVARTHIGIAIAIEPEEERRMKLHRARVSVTHSMENELLELFSLDEDRLAEVSHA